MKAPKGCVFGELFGRKNRMVSWSVNDQHVWDFYSPVSYETGSPLIPISSPLVLPRSRLLIISFRPVLDHADRSSR